MSVFFDNQQCKILLLMFWNDIDVNSMIHEAFKINVKTETTVKKIYWQMTYDF